MFWRDVCSFLFLSMPSERPGQKIVIKNLACDRRRAGTFSYHDIWHVYIFY
jgi:hypothetical protein